MNNKYMNGFSYTNNHLLKKNTSRVILPPINKNTPKQNINNEYTTDKKKTDIKKI